MITILIIVSLIVLYVIILFNRLVSMRNQIKEAYGALDIYLQNRHDALTKVADAVIAYAKYEESTLKDITKLRHGVNQRPTEEAYPIYEQMSERLNAINVLAEDYPELKASKNYLHLQETANDLEEKLSASRRTVNSNVTIFNTAISSFPAIIFAGLLGFRTKALLDIPESKKADVSIKQMLSR